MQPYPLTFEPLLKHRVWGGRALESLGKRLPPGEIIGESWEIADLPDSVQDGRSIIANGPLAGLSLRSAISRLGAGIMGRRLLTPAGGFPLLIKYLDAQQNLSVQVHPDKSYVLSHPEAHLKSEAWVVVRAEPGAVIYRGLKPGLDPTVFAEHIRTGRVVDDLVAVPAVPGECHYLPSGTCHALGAGVIVAEVQTPSDTTFRVFDWGRTGRELHIDQALECIHFQPDPPVGRLPPPLEVDEFLTTPLCRTEYFAIDRVEIRAPTELDVVTSGEPLIWMMISGLAGLNGLHADALALGPGATVLFPAETAFCTARFERPSTVLRITLPSLAEGKIA